MAKASKKITVDAPSLEKLGASRLAELLLELADGDAVLKRRLKFELTMLSDPSAAAKEIDKRIANLARSRSYVDWNRMRAFVHDLDTTRAMIAGKLVETDAKRAYDLMWSFIGVAGACYDRCDDSNGQVGGVFSTALRDLGTLAVAARPGKEALVGRVAAAIEANDYGQFDGIIPIVSTALGTEGLLALRTVVDDNLAKAKAEAERTTKPEPRKIGAVTIISRADMAAFRPESRVRALRYARQEISDLLGDVDGYIAAIEPETRKMPRIAIDIAARLLKAGRPEGALRALDAVDASMSAHVAFDLETARIGVLDALGRANEAQKLRWTSFERTLDPDRLRDHLSRLPDFEDFEAEQKALDLADKAANHVAALAFFLHWKALERAAWLVSRHAGTWDGDLYEVLSPAADALDERHPLASTILRRAMIDFTLKNGRSARYPYAAADLAACHALAQRIDDFSPLPDHDRYLAGLRKSQGRKHGFWSLVPKDIA